MSIRECAARDIAVFKGRPVLVIGDLILDHYLEGSIERISPEAPVPVVSLRPDGERSRPGGAANVAMNVFSLGGRPYVAGLTGSDPDGRLLIDLMSSSGIDVSGVLEDSSRPTTSKTRIMARHQQILRIDRESVLPADGAVTRALCRAALELLDSVEAVIFEDYDKGAIDSELISALIPECRRRGIPVAVDPKFRNFLSYSGCTVIKPNRAEASRVSGMEIATPEDAAAAGGALLERLGATAVLVTLGEQGSVLVETGRKPVFQPTAARRVFDVSGAGDTVIAVMALGVASGLSFEKAAGLASYAAAAVCAEPGVYAVTPGDILRELGSDE